MTRKQIAIVVAIVAVILGSVFVLPIFFGGKTEAQPAPPPQTVEVQIPRPISNVMCEGTYQFTHLERFMVGDRVAVNFTFGGADRNLQPQYIWDRNVIGQSTEVREGRKVDRSLEYSTVTFLCLGAPTLEGHKISNVEVMRYRLTLRRPLRQQKVIRNGGPARQ